MSWGTIQNGVKTYTLHSGQSAVIRADARFKAAIAGTGGGKTAMGPIWVMQQIQRMQAERDLEQHPILGLIVAPTYPVLARATMPTLVDMFTDTDLEGTWKESTNKYVLPDGMGILWTLSADRPGGLEGGQFDFCWIDEGGQIKYDSWIAIQGRLGQKQGPALITTTPYGQNWLFHKFYSHWKRGDPDYFVHQWGSADNPAYPQAEFDRAKRAMSPQRFAMRYKGHFVKLAGLVYPDLSACAEDFDPTKIDGVQYGGIDFGWNDPFAALVGKWDGKHLWIWYERYKRFMTVAQHARALPRHCMYWADPSRPDSIRDLRNAGLTVRPGKVRSIATGVDIVNEWLYGGWVKIHPSCVAIIAESHEYAYPQKDDDVSGDDPIDEFNHASDALRYLLANVNKRVVRIAA